MKFLLTVLLAAVLAAANAKQTFFSGNKEFGVNGVPLYDYVDAADDNYSWFNTGLDLQGPGWTGTLLNMTSQQWLSDSEIKDGKGLWSHQLLIIRPSLVMAEDVGALYITGGNNPGGHIKPTSVDVLIPTILAMQSNITTAVLFQIPNQPTVFTSDPKQDSRIEDNLIAYSWMEFVKNPSRPDLVAYFPMVKAVARALDTMTAFSQQQVDNKEWRTPLTRFYLAGASKRGATTWLAGAYEGAKNAVERRVLGISPIVFDTLNFTTTVPRMYELYGGWSFAFAPYQRAGVTELVGVEGMDILASAVDPLYPTYLPGLANVDKHVVTSSGDEFFVLDNDKFWWHAMPEPKSRYIANNAEHALVTNIAGVLGSISGHINSIVYKFPRANVKWNTDSITGTLTAYSDLKPSKVKVYRAETNPSVPDSRRDFRLIKANIEGNCPSPAVPIDSSKCVNPVLWKDTTLNGSYDDASGMYTYSYTEETVSERWAGYFIQFEYPSGQVVTTQATVWPDTKPFKPCGSGKDCFGTLV